MTEEEYKKTIEEVKALNLVGGKPNISRRPMILTKVISLLRSIYKIPIIGYFLKVVASMITLPKTVDKITQQMEITSELHTFVDDLFELNKKIFELNKRVRELESKSDKIVKL